MAYPGNSIPNLAASFTWGSERRIGNLKKPEAVSSRKRTTANLSSLLWGEASVCHHGLCGRDLLQRPDSGFCTMNLAAKKEDEIFGEIEIRSGTERRKRLRDVFGENEGRSSLPLDCLAITDELFPSARRHREQAPSFAYDRRCFSSARRTPFQPPAIHKQPEVAVPSRARIPNPQTQPHLSRYPPATFTRCRSISELRRSAPPPLLCPIELNLRPTFYDGSEKPDAFGSFKTAGNQNNKL
ncbi:plant invertase/pectin methylesterase inhibitor [Striga asiatica]|uniref:Plant invertase/pectin methylesterase inhibitor n=1 Tax=Striga asiatica TaxID=4170 RepID=A0A5A7P7B8_STRAF|nr:plant invertase/pectin methylesterase inhibitor [Striga asiatica]